MGLVESAPKRWSAPFLSSSSFRAQTPPCSPLDDAPWALIILNTSFSRELLDLVWRFCEVRYCADGGANRLHETLDKSDRINFIPDLIKGDLDSIRPDVQLYYSTHSVPIVQDGDQYATDLMKCLASLAETEQAKGLKYNVLLLGGLAGRLDQTIHTLSYLLKQRRVRPHMMAITDDSLAWVLDEGKHELCIDQARIGPTCGLLPLGNSDCRLTTTGLEWDLNDAETSVEGLLSTSNHVVADVVTVHTTRPLIWTVAVQGFS